MLPFVFGLLRLGFRSFCQYFRAFLSQEGRGVAEQCLLQEALCILSVGGFPK